jgi:hypothetical protein
LSAWCQQRWHERQKKLTSSPSNTGCSASARQLGQRTGVAKIVMRLTMLGVPVR